MQNSHDTQVLIVGAGPTGLTLGIELARRSVPFRLVDGADGPFQGSRGKGTQPRSLEIFHDLGIVNEVLANGRYNMPMRLYDEAGNHRDQTVHAEAEPSPGVPYPVTLLIPQWRVEGALRHKLEELGGRVEYGVRLEALTQDEAGVTATLAGKDGQESCHAAWLVGCDGGKSATRHLIDVPFLGETMEQFRMMVGDVKASGLNRDFWHVWRKEHSFLALAPLPNTDQFQFQASIDQHTTTEPSLELFRQLLQERTGRSDIALSDPSWMSFWRANVRMVEHYRAGRVLLAGDAAHVHTPAGGQGMNTGIQDAFNLGWKLAAVVAGAQEGLIDSYEQERLPVAAGILGLSTRLFNSMVAQGGNMAARRDGSTLQLGIGYRDSAWVEELRAEPGLVRAGDRAPDAPGLVGADGTTRLFDLMRGTHFTVLAFGKKWTDVVFRAKERFGAMLRVVQIDGEQWRDSGGHAAQGYGVTRDTLFVIRPDWHVGFAADETDAQAVLDYLARFAAP
jgi:2-polyprenyl-6-methoxyphenol hydroxylase-like FAD-dependent oxidoreductase